MSFAESEESKKAQLELFFELEQRNQSMCVDVCVKERERECQCAQEGLLQTLTSHISLAPSSV